MARQRFDMSSKWLLHNQGKGALFVGGLTGIRRVEAMPGEIVQNRKYPDGLLRAFFQGNPAPQHVLIEVATYAEKRALKQALDDLTLAYHALGHLPELLMLILRPKGRFRIIGKHAVHSPLGLSRLEVEWRPVELWTLSAEEFLAAGDAGVVPWVPLMRFDGAPEALLERCAEAIERQAEPKDQADLLAVAQVLTELRFPDRGLLSLLGGKAMMIESPLLQELVAERMHKMTLALLKARFGTVPRDVSRELRKILDEKKLTDLNILAAQCCDIQAFRDALP